MKVLLCNVGSTSLKYRLIDMEGETTLLLGKVERVGSDQALFAYDGPSGHVGETLALKTHRDAIERMLAAFSGDVPLSEVDCVGFKVVHAQGVTGVQLLTEDVLAAMEAYNGIAPAHNPPYIAAVRMFRELLPGVPLVGSFETGFHRTIPLYAAAYPLPAELTRQGVRKYGFHGNSHEYMYEWVAKAMGRRDFKLVSCHLGGSGSITAVDGGRSIENTFGFTLQSGIMHNNRIGDIDPFITFYLLEEQGMSVEQVKELYTKKSGFYGMSGGVSNDLRDIEAAAAKGNEDAQLAIDAYCYQIKKVIGGYTAAMDGIDAIAFGGGIGENSALVRAKITDGLGFFGVRLDGAANEAIRGEGPISAAGSRVRVFVVATNEEIMVARKAAQLLQA